MIAVIQRVKKSSVTIENKTVAKIGKGINILLGIHNTDNADDALLLAKKIANLRIFEDEEGKMNLSLKDIQGTILAISQFTLCANLKKGRRPSFISAMAPDDAENTFQKFVAFLRNFGYTVQTGRFGSKMSVGIINDGPVTFVLDSKQLK